MTHLFRAFILTCVVLSATLFADAPAVASKAQHTQGKSTTSGKKPARKPSKPAKTISAEEEAKILEFTKANLPAMYKKLVDSKKQSEKRYQYMLRITASHVRSLMNQPKEIRNANIKLAQSKIRLYKLVQDYLKAGKKEDVKAKLKPKIQSEIAQQFDAKMAIRAHKLGKLEGQLRQLQSEMDRAKQNREKTIQRDTNNMIQNAEKGRMPSSLRPRSPSKPTTKKPTAKKPATKKPADKPKS